MRSRLNVKALNKPKTKFCPGPQNTIEINHTEDFMKYLQRWAWHESPHCRRCIGLPDRLQVSQTELPADSVHPPKWSYADHLEWSACPPETRWWQARRRWRWKPQIWRLGSLSQPDPGEILWIQPGQTDKKTNDLRMQHT